ncbi:MAG: PQQ-binding-like beta-propeller repeat protein [Acinetobacter sp.]|nr:PQQ-binding-like beta-propeller repeat protein [Acinetobacter sp.]
MINKKLTVIALALTSVLAVGCASKNKAIVAETKPLPLQKLEHVQIALHEVASYSTSSYKNDDRLGLRMQSLAGVDYIVDRKGEVSAYQGKQRVWQNRVSKKGLTAGVEVKNGAVIVANADGQIFALNQQTGEVRWTAQIASAVLTPSLIVNTTVVTLSNDGTVYGHSLESGQKLWAYKLADVEFSLRGQAKPIALDQRQVLVASSSGQVYVLDSLTGLVATQFRAAESSGRSQINRLIDVDGEPIYLPAEQALITTGFQGQLARTNLVTQRQEWLVDISSSQSPATDGKERVFVSASNGKLAAYHLATGRELWVNEQLLRRKLSNPVWFNGVLVVGDLDGILHIINAETGEFIGRAKAKGAIKNLTVDGDKLIVSSSSGDISVWKF